MKKIAFVVCQYGKEVNGGAEVHCKMLAERLTSYYEVHVLTSTIINYSTFEPYYNVGVENINRVTVRRFHSKAFNKELHNSLWRRSRLGRKVRRMLYRVGLLKRMANIQPVWNLSIEKEKEWLETHGFYSPDLLEYLAKHGHEYDAIILMSYPYPHTFFVTEMFPEKCILIPTAHEEGELYRSIQTHLFTKVGHIAFNTQAERQLCENVFGNKMADNSIVSVGVDLTEGGNKEDIQEKFNLPKQYVLYFGRICTSKNVNKLIEYFLDYKRKYTSSVKLVLAGRLFMPKIEHEDIIYTGFVSESEKTSLIENSIFVVNPSENESLSLLLLEAMSLGKTALVNGRSEVMKQHCIHSDGAVSYYMSKKDFHRQLDELLNSEGTTQVNMKAIDYVNKNYSWDIILGKFCEIIDKKES